MGPSSALDSPASDATAAPARPQVVPPRPAEGDTRVIARAYALEILALAPGPVTDAIVEAAVHRNIGRKGRPVDRGKVEGAVREETYRRQQQAERAAKGSRRPARRAVLVLALLVSCALVIVVLAVGIRSLSDAIGADEPERTVVRGRVEAGSGDSVTDALVTVTDPAGGTVAEVVADLDGAFVVGDLSEGGYVLVVTDRAGQLEPATADVFVEPGDDVAVTIVLDTP